MANQHFVYGEYERPGDATRAVTSLIDSSFEPDEIDVLAIRDGVLERVPLVHHRPVAGGGIIGVCLGLVVGMAIGLTFGQQMDPATPAWANVVRWMLYASMIGGVAGALGGLVWWRTKVIIRGRHAQAQRFIVGTTVSAGRAPRAVEVLERHAPELVRHYPVSAGEVLQQHVERQVVPHV